MSTSPLGMQAAPEPSAISFVFVWGIVGLTAYVVWRMGGFSMLDPVMHAVM